MAAPTSITSTTATSSAASSSSGSKMSGGAIAGVSIVMILLFGGIAAGIIFYLRRRNSDGKWRGVDDSQKSVSFLSFFRSRFPPQVRTI